MTARRESALVDRDTTVRHKLPHPLRFVTNSERFDPIRFPLFRAYRTLFRQWSIIFAIGGANRTQGASVSASRRLLALVHAHLTMPLPYGLSD